MSRRARKWVRKSISRDTIPTAPSLTHPLSVYTAPTYKGVKSVTELNCENLGKKSCNNENSRGRCKWSNQDSMCEPVGDVAYGLYLSSIKHLWRAEVMRWINQHTEECNLADLFSNTKIFSSTEKSSTSSSIIIAGLINPISSLRKEKNNIIAKLSFDPKITGSRFYDNSLLVERSIYKYIINALIANKHTPNVLFYLGEGQCRYEKIKLDTKQQKAFVEELSSISSKYDKNRYNLLYLELSNGIALNRWLRKGQDFKDLLAVCFQILYTLVCFANIELVHNDMHFGNIFVEELDREIVMYFNRGNGEYVELTSKYIPKIYDFDRSYCSNPLVPRNLLLDKSFCKEYGTYNKSNDKFDAWTFVFEFFESNYFPREDSAAIQKKFDIWRKKLYSADWYKEFRKTTETRQLLNTYPSDDELKPVYYMFTSLLEIPWADSPFIIKKGDITSLPQELVFTPPEKVRRKIITWEPVSSGNYTSLDIDQYIDAHYSDPMKIYGEYWGTIDKIVLAWNDGHVSIMSKTLLREALKRKPEISKIQNLYAIVCSMLCSPAYYELNSESIAVLDGSGGLLPIISDIWNLFQNKLPIKIRISTMKEDLVPVQDSLTPKMVSALEYFDLERIEEKNEVFPDVREVWSRQTDVNLRMRRILLDWIVIVAGSIRIDRSTFYLTAYLIDNIISEYEVKRASLQLLGGACIYVATLITLPQEVDPELIDELVRLSDKAFTPVQLTDMINRVMHDGVPKCIISPYNWMLLLFLSKEKSDIHLDRDFCYLEGQVSDSLFTSCMRLVDMATILGDAPITDSSELALAAFITFMNITDTNYLTRVKPESLSYMKTIKGLSFELKDEESIKQPRVVQKPWIKEYELEQSKKKAS